MNMHSGLALDGLCSSGAGCPTGAVMRGRDCDGGSSFRLHRKLLVGVQFGVAAQDQRTAVGGWEVDVEHLDDGELVEHGLRREAPRLEPGAQRDGQASAPRRTRAPPEIVDGEPRQKRRPK